jgi:hypothetical protein
MRLRWRAAIFFNSNLNLMFDFLKKTN